jgi:pimeloyl-ACP methyl ester carboxylesterase
MDVSRWLRDLGLENYVQAFQDHDIDAEVLPRLTADDLTAVGITSVGHRRKLLDAIAALDQERAAVAAGPRLGVLCVHGIGSQVRGATLSDFADPIINCIERLQGKVRIVGSGVYDPDPTAPLDVLVEVSPFPFDVTELMQEDDAIYRKILFAESHWAETFPPPRFSDLAIWLLSIGPWAIVSSVLEVIRFRFAAPHQILWSFCHQIVILPAVLALCFLFQLSVCVLWLFAALPVPQLRAFLSDVLLNLTGVLGDSFVLESPSKRSMILSRIRRDCQWLRAKCRCEKVFILAHSQGAYVAANALDGFNGVVDLLITFGSAVKRIELMLELGRVHPLFRFLFGAMIPLAISAVFLSLYLQINSGAFRISLIAFAVVAIGTMRFLPYLPSLRKRELSPREFLIDRLTQLRQCVGGWIDYYASRDPVPAGSLPDIESICVTNQRSLIRDHTTYWSNRDEFVLPIVDRLLVEIHHMRMPDRNRIPERRAKRVLALMTGRFLFIACLVFVWWGNVFYYSGRFVELFERLRGAGFELGGLAEEVARVARVPGDATTGGPWSAIYVSAFLGFFYVASMLLWRLWDRQVFLQVTRFALFPPEVAAVAYVVVVGWSCGTALRFYYGGELMSNLLLFFAIGLVFVLFAAATFVVLVILFRNQIREVVRRRYQAMHKSWWA